MPAPLVISWGNNDAFCTFKGQEILVNNIKDSRLIISYMETLVMHWEEPGKFSEDLVNFIDNVIRLD